MKESEMFEAVKTWLVEKVGCDEVYGEVQDIDVVGFCGNLDFVVELKATFSMKLLEQAIARSWRANYVYICMPYEIASKCSHSQVTVCLRKQFGFGILGYKRGYKGDTYITVFIQAELKRVKSRTRLRDYILPHHKLTVGGCTSKEAITPYKITIDNIKNYLRIHTYRGEWVTINQILDNVETHYANPKGSVMATLKMSWNETWCESGIDEKGRRVFRYRKDEGKS